VVVWGWCFDADWSSGMTNQQMKANRFGIWALARRKKAWIDSAIDGGRYVYLCTRLRAIKITRPDQTKATKSGLYVQRGKSWDCADGCELRAR
jgi:hypothetical protein